MVVRARNDEGNDDGQRQSQRQRKEACFSFQETAVNAYSYLETTWFFLSEVFRDFLKTRYTTISQLWDVGPGNSFGSTDGIFDGATAIARISTPSIYREATPDGAQTTKDHSAATIATFADDNYEASNAQNPRTSHADTVVKDTIWPSDAVLIRSTNGGYWRSGHLAHLVPATSADASTWWFVPPLIFGKKTDENGGDLWTFKERMKCIHGSGLTGSNRAAHTGIKHMTTNKIRLAGQADCFDKRPCVMIIPIMEPEDVRNWKGEGYDAIMLADGYGNMDLGEVLAQTNLDRPSPDFNMAKPKEIETARVLLAYFLRAILTLCQDGNRPDDIPEDVQSHKKGPFHKGDTIEIPSKAKLFSPRVRKISFVNNDWNGDPNRHPAPDPILLTTKSAVNFSIIQKQRLAASAGPEDEDEGDHWTEMDQIAAEHYLEWREQGLRAHMASDEALSSLMVGPEIHR